MLLQAGKSFIAYLIFKYLNIPTLIIVPSISLVNQFASDLISYGMKEEDIHRIYYGHEKHFKKPITIGVWNSLYKLPQEIYDNIGLVIGDEAHTFTAASLNTLMYKITNAEYRVGMSGSFHDAKVHKLQLEGLFGPYKEIAKTKKLIEKNIVTPVNINITLLKYNDVHRRIVSLMQYDKEIDFLKSNNQRNNFIVNLSLSLKNNTLILFRHIDTHGKMLYNSIKAKTDRPVFFVCGKTAADDREHIRKIVESYDDAILVCSYGTFSTGISINNLHNLILAAPYKNKIKIIQSIGRTLRKMSSKKIANVYDIADDLGYEGRDNYSYAHMLERINVYKDEGFPFKIIPIKFK